MGPGLSWLGRAPCQSRPCQQCLWELGLQGGSGVCVGWGRGYPDIWQRCGICSFRARAYLSVLVTGAAKTRSRTQTLPSAGPSRPVLHLNLTVSWRRTGRGGGCALGRDCHQWLTPFSFWPVAPPPTHSLPGGSGGWDFGSLFGIMAGLRLGAVQSAGAEEKPVGEGVGRVQIGL